MLMKHMDFTKLGKLALIVACFSSIGFIASAQNGRPLITNSVWDGQQMPDKFGESHNIHISCNVPIAGKRDFGISYTAQRGVYRPENPNSVYPEFKLSSISIDNKNIKISGKNYLDYIMSRSKYFRIEPFQWCLPDGTIQIFIRAQPLTSKSEDEYRMSVIINQIGRQTRLLAGDKVKIAFALKPQD